MQMISPSRSIAFVALIAKYEQTILGDEKVGLNIISSNEFRASLDGCCSVKQHHSCLSVTSFTELHTLLPIHTVNAFF